MFDQVNVDEYPTLADLRARNFAGAGLLLQRHRVDVEEGGSGLQIEGVHNEANLDHGVVKGVEVTVVAPIPVRYQHYVL